LKEGEKQNFDKMVDQLSTPEWRKKFISEKDSVKNMYRNFVVSGIWMQLSAIDYDWNTKVWVWVSWWISNEKFNAALSKVY
jgi:hypothetical protein